MQRRLSLILMLLSTLTVVTQVCADPKVKLTGTFTDMSYNQEGGDVVGHELRIVVTTAGYEGIYQVAEGEPSELMVVNIAFEKNNKISFLIPSGTYAGSFTGAISDKGITGVFNHRGGAAEHINLPRHTSYWD